MGLFNWFRKRANTESVWVSDAELTRRAKRRGDKIDSLPNEFNLSAERMLAAILDIEPGYYVFPDGKGRYYSCGVAGTSWPDLFSTVEGCVRGAFLRFCHGQHTRDYKEYSFDGRQFILRPKETRDDSLASLKRGVRAMEDSQRELSNLFG